MRKNMIPVMMLHGCEVKMDSLIKYVRNKNGHKCGVLYAERTHGHAPPFAVLIGWSQDTRVHYVEIENERAGRKHRKRMPFDLTEAVGTATGRVELSYEPLYRHYVESHNRDTQFDFSARPELSYRNEDGEVQSRPSPPRFVREQLPAFIRQVRQEFKVWNSEIYIADMDVDIQQEIMDASSSPVRYQWIAG